MDVFTKISEFIDFAITYLGVYGPVLGCFMIVIESILPVLPLCVFITLNFLSFGNVLGFILSWIFTVFGCCLSFYLCRKGLRNWFVKRVIKIDLVNSFMKRIDKLTFQQLVVIVAIPFTPAFAVNIAAGLSKMPTKKFILAMIIGKTFMVYFWGFVGTSFIQSLTNPSALISVVIASIIAYIISLVINKKFNLDK